MGAELGLVHRMAVIFLRVGRAQAGWESHPGILAASFSGANTLPFWRFACYAGRAGRGRAFRSPSG